MFLPRTKPLAALFCCAALCGCALVDQRSFDRHAGVAPTPPAAKQLTGGSPPAPPLLVVQPAAGSDWQTDLRHAVADALARKPNVLFTVESVVPVASSPAAQATSMRNATANVGIPVADAILADGARPAQIEIAAASDPAVGQAEVRIFVR